MKKKFRHLSLFSGCGGMDLGIAGDFDVHKAFLGKNSNINFFTKLPKTKFETVFANDIKNDSYKFWKKNYPKMAKNFRLGSIVDLVKEHKIKQNIFPKDIDLLTGGFPCQDFSVSGLRKGFNSHKSHLNDKKIINKNETRGQLYLWMKEVINLTKPKIFLAENVKGISNLGTVFEIIKKDFSEINNGYEVFTKELFAPNFGIPQSRRRIFFVGVNKDFISSCKINFSEINLFPEIEFEKEKTLFNNLVFPKSKYFFDGLQEPLESNDLSQKYYSKAKYFPNTQGQTEVNENGFAPTIRSEHHGNIEFRYLSSEFGGTNIKSNNISQRRLSVRECARIQTFPDELEFVFDIGKKHGLSASAAYKLIGDAVPPLLAYKIAKKIEEFLLKYS